MLRPLYALLACVTPLVVAAQTPSDAVMMPKGEICIAALYGNESWDEYWEGTLLRTNGNIGTFTKTSIMPMFALGLADRINVIAMLPWVHTKSSQGQLAGTSGFQDFGLFIKATAINGSASRTRCISRPATLPAIQKRTSSNER